VSGLRELGVRVLVCLRDTAGRLAQLGPLAVVSETEEMHDLGADDKVARRHVL
jgi:hypothetical protein